MINTMPSDPDKIHHQILECIKNSSRRLTPLAIEKELLSKNSAWSKKTLHQSLKKLIAQGELSYTYEFGTSFLEPSYNKPVRISDHVVIKPEHHSFTAKKDDIVLTLQTGAAFGSGRHPSTRLALTSIEKVMLIDKYITDNYLTALDIGTGSGVLAIAAVLMGIERALGLDIDPCARSEAAQNVRLNRLTNNVVIDHRPLEAVNETFILVLANLRFPTLIDICQHISDRLKQNGIAVLSGLKIDEVDPITKHYQRLNMIKLFSFTETDWASVVFQKEKIRHESPIQF